MLKNRRFATLWAPTASYRESFTFLKGKYDPVVKNHTMNAYADVKVLKLSYFSTTCGKRPEECPAQVYTRIFRMRSSIFCVPQWSASESNIETKATTANPTTLQMPHFMIHK